MKTRVLVVNPDAAVRVSLADMLALESDLQVSHCGERLAETLLEKIQPDVVLVSVSSPQQLRKLASVCDHCQILALTSEARHVGDLQWAGQRVSTLDRLIPYEGLLGAIRQASAQIPRP